MTVWLSDGGSRRGQGRNLLVEAAAAQLGCPAGAITLDREDGGRPVLGGAATGLHVALAHTREGAAAVACSLAGPVGVDVEHLRELPVAGLAARWFAPAECHWLAQQPPEDRSAAFLLLWTQKEAVGKALGTGLRGSGLRREVPRLAADADEPRPRPVPGHAPLLVTAWSHRPGLILAVAGHAEAVVVRDLAG
ncbi:phosphopantetheinyl transferase [Allocatelliglobosispora scoriae]|uniref:Phosphopantetheinyl transferase n=1 Tax=Allocatelliglobosispora scoriae TaxID=643052 RepID=A0A841BYN3_9ACTN|nr:4'-phosphopantetheinyl transferase superfamily protein [Allocatelliglobosispora scoriae]MBB5872598.1 phosphopantetheinyl transferase [Allocatelliglobosispora scoriae]